MIYNYNTATGSTVTFTNPFPNRTVTATHQALCPDLLCYEQIGGADGLRGRLVRGIFWMLRVWPPRRR